MQAERHRRPADGGSTIVELGITVAILAIVSQVALSVLVSLQNAVSREQSRSQTTDEARIAVAQLDRQIRSGNLFYDPALENPPGLALRIYTQTSSQFRCNQWKIAPGGNLQTRSWTPTWSEDGQVTSWRTVAAGLQNTTFTPAFKLDTNGGFGGRLLDVDLLVNYNTGKGGNAEVQAAIAGRNTQYGYSPNVCGVIPP